MRIAITGASGSLGTALLTRLTQSGAERIVCFSRDEQKRARIASEFGWHPGVRVFAGDVRDDDRLQDLFRDCEVVVHAAARKVVTSHPDEADEMLRTNVLGTRNVIEASRRAGVRKLLFISSDKAVHAEGQAYGISKALAERLVISANARAHRDGLRLSVMRYGNCLGSNGSVLVKWRESSKEKIELSHVDMTRFWLTMEQAVDFVVKAVDLLRGGEIFVPHIPAAKVSDLATAILGRVPTFTITGIRRGGEKLHEQLLSADETRRTLKWQGFYVVPPDIAPDVIWDSSRWLGEPIDPATVYRSDVWPHRLSADEMRTLIGAARL